MNKQNFLSILHNVGQRIHLEDLELDEDNFCSIGFDDDLIVTISYEERSNMLLIFGQLGKISPELEEDIYPKLLKANYFWQGTSGATLGVDDQTHEVILSYRLNVPNLTSDQLYQLLEEFVNLVDLWKKNLGLYQKGIQNMNQ